MSLLFKFNHFNRKQVDTNSSVHVILMAYQQQGHNNNTTLDSSHWLSYVHLICPSMYSTNHSNGVLYLASKVSLKPTEPSWCDLPSTEQSMIWHINNDSTLCCWMLLHDSQVSNKNSSHKNAILHEICSSWSCCKAASGLLALRLSAMYTELKGLQNQSNDYFHLLYLRVQTGKNHNMKRKILWLLF